MTAEAVDDLQLYTIDDIIQRAKLSRREINRNMKEPGCPLVLRVVGKKKKCDAATLRAYLGWLWERAQASGR